MMVNTVLKRGQNNLNAKKEKIEVKMHYSTTKYPFYE